MQRKLKMRWTAIAVCIAFLCSTACQKQSGTVAGPVPIIPPVTPPVVNTGSILNTAHLNKLEVPVVFANGEKATAIYIYADAPNYTPVAAGGEGFACVDDVARGVLFYLRSSTFLTDTLVQNKVYGMLRFIINMQSDIGYFYNFFQAGNAINKTGITSVNQPKWWSWRALQALTEAVPVIKQKNTILAGQAELAVDKLIYAIKLNQVNLPLTTISVNGIDVPQWLPEGADQAATLLFGLIAFCQSNNDAVIKAYIRKLADGIAFTQFGDASHFPYSCFLSSGNTWHAYGSDQASALFKTGAFLNDTAYINKAFSEVNNFYPWLINYGFKNSFDVSAANNSYTASNSKDFEQIAYGIRPMVFAAIEAYVITKDEKYADMAGRLAAWFLGKNSASVNMFSVTTGRCFDAINTGNSVNKNSGAESTIEALLTMQRVNDYPTVKAAMDRYKL
ncbi:hypothetical protein BH11BAC3_BH11BAC3_17890 [soil metagenome]